MSELTVGQLRGLTVNNNVITVPSGHTLYSPGHVVQTIHTTYTGLFSTTSATLSNVTGFSASITPKFASSSILINVSVAFGFANDAYPYVLLLRNGTSIGTGVSATSGGINTFLSGTATAISSMPYRFHQFARSHEDYPNTTSPLTYQIQMASPYNSLAGYINRQGQGTGGASYFQSPASSITVMEIAQ
jgi:hypothetical protein